MVDALQVSKSTHHEDDNFATTLAEIEAEKEALMAEFGQDLAQTGLELEKEDSSSDASNSSNKSDSDSSSDSSDSDAMEGEEDSSESDDSSTDSDEDGSTNSGSSSDSKNAAQIDSYTEMLAQINAEIEEDEQVRDESLSLF